MGPMTIARRRLLAGAAVAVATVGRRRVAWSAEGDTLRLREGADIQQLDPAFIVNNIEETVNDSILMRLTDFVGDATYTTRPYLAKRIEQTDPETVEFELHEGFTWSNGFGPVTAEDVKYSYERIANPEFQSPWLDSWSILKTIELDGLYAGRMKFREPFVAIWGVLPSWAGHIVSQKATESVGGRFTVDPPAICGPYLIGDWLPKQKLVLKPNPDWPGEAPVFQTVEILLIDDVKSAELAFEAGELDFTTISTSSIETFKASTPAGSELLVKSGENYLWLGMNTDHPLLQDIRVRQAIQHAIDVDAILVAVYGGVIPRGTGIVPPSLMGHREHNRIETRDLDKARALLAEAGKADGFACTLTILNTTERRATAEVIQANLAEIGITVEILSYEGSTFWNLGLESEGEDWKNLQLYLGQFTSLSDPYLNTQWFTPEQVGVWNWERWNSAEFGDLHKKALGETDPKKRAAMYVKMQDLMEDSGAYVFIAHEPDAAIYRGAIAPALRPDLVVQAKGTRPA